MTKDSLYIFLNRILSHGTPYNQRIVVQQLKTIIEDETEDPKKKQELLSILDDVINNAAECFSMVQERGLDDTSLRLAVKRGNEKFLERMRNYGRC